ncbi:MAG: acylneuraminate cytidylyltransferase family protein [Actinomycetota bacterium]|nr:acylneuraminate cytidylyltransferase family protein [Actinomycetota bacterium]
MIVPGGTPFLAVVPARGGSTRVPGKNRRPLAGRPLVEWTIAHVARCATPMRLVVSTDSDEIAALAVRAGAEVPFLRPAELATDEAPTEPVLLHALAATPGASEAEHVVLLPPTSPIRRDGTIDAAVARYRELGADSLVSVTEVSPLQWSGPPDAPRALYDTGRRPRLQSVPPEARRYRENGSVVITSVAGLRATGNRICGRTVMYVMTREEGIDVDCEHDFWLADQWLRSNHAC